ncbi:hypothetical protein H257_16896 [Aphanomyces astaci]|uniref:Uncharacterized protein n=1 Tax=Aphanomyces astaci TaxID=112090 RepID=W4FIX6_APHAT|nr:hypothetical protein H257_16896 [Aphanomyces astaci]ETV66683.1 hypothetical protein H257_16896 [Aphanomyces astaci]RQM22209.1 hypothetical protein B5M09_007209 [Aphanomyces astaci]|eukprot:XP_009843808.1 hypothetical protein H257_16896 [Aphanomyces astaci]
MEAALDACVNDKVLRRRLLFHWTTAHAMLLRIPESSFSTSTLKPEDEQQPPKVSSALALSRIHSSAFIRLLHTMQSSKDKPFSRSLPSTVMEHFCDACFGLIIPGKSAHVRIIHQSHNAAVNKKLARVHAASKRKAKVLHKSIAPCIRVRNAVVTTCHHCRHRHTLPGTPVAAKKVRAAAAKPAVVAAPVTLKRTHDSIFGPPPSPPRKLLDGKKKKKKTPTPTPPSALDSFFKSLQ